MTEHKMTLLIVEDDLLVQTLYQYILPDHYQLLMSESVWEAKEILQTNRVDCVILDLSLAGEDDGLTLARYIRQEMKNAQLPIIAVTAHAFPLDRQEALDAGCTEYMSKPLEVNPLLEMIQNLTKI